MKIGAVIITYNPNINILKKNIDAIFFQVDELLIVDNGSKNINEIEKVFDYEVIKNIENQGIAYATNQAMKYFKSKRFHWVLTLDQDTIVAGTLIKNFLRFSAVKNVGMLTPVYVDRNNRVNDNDTCDDDFSEVLKPIASGALIKISAWSEINGFDEDLFIDRVDDDFDLRLRKKGFRLLQVNSVKISHEIGKIKIFNIGKFEIQIFNHSAVRKYFIARNAIIFCKKHGEWGEAFKRIVVLCLKVLFFEDDKILKIKKIIYGVKDGIMYKTRQRE